MKITTRNLLTSLTLLGLLGACGDAKKEVSDRDRMMDDAEEAAARAAADGSNIQGAYVATFTTLNGHIVGTIPGATVLRRNENQLMAYVRFTLGAPSVAHFQNIHTGTRCPNLSDDTNRDGYIDIQEALAVVGPVLVPLDWDIGSQLSANRSWPKAFENGSYEYTKITSFKHFWSDLKAEDKNPNDNIVKLAPDQGFPVTGRVVMVQGVGEKPIFDATLGEFTGTLPDTVAGNGRWKNFQTLPVVCGVFMPSSEETGRPYDGSLSFPTSPVVEGQDQPAPEGAGEHSGSGTVITTGSNRSGSNDSGSSTTSGDGSSSTTTTSDDGTRTTTTTTDDNGRTTTTTTTTSGSSTSSGSTTTTGGNTGNYGDDEEDDDEGGICWPWEDDCKNA